MKSRLPSLLVVLAALSVAACGTQREVPPAHVGKRLTSSGLQQGVIPPGNIMLESWCHNCDSLVLAPAGDYPFKETMPIFMPADNLNLTVEVRGTLSIPADDANMARIFSKITPGAPTERVSTIVFQSVYSTYAEPIIRGGTRTIVTNHKIAQVMENRDAVAQEVWKDLQEKMKDTPFKLVHFELADVQPPAIIVEAQETAKKREVELTKAEADKAIRLKQAEADYEVALKVQQVELKEAETQLLVDKKISEVSEAVIAQRALKVLDKLAGSQNQVFFVSSDILRNPAAMIGINQQVFRGNNGPKGPAAASADKQE